MRGLGGARVWAGRWGRFKEGLGKGSEGGFGHKGGLGFKEADGKRPQTAPPQTPHPTTRAQTGPPSPPKNPSEKAPTSSIVIFGMNWYTAVATGIHFAWSLPMPFRAMARSFSSWGGGGQRRVGRWVGGWVGRGRGGGRAGGWGQGQGQGQGQG